MKPIKTLKLGELLVNAGAISAANLQAALGEQKISHMRLGEVLIKNGYLTEMHLAEALSAQLEIPFISLLKERPNQNSLSMIPENVAVRLNIIPLSLTYDGRITVAMSDPMDTLAIDEISMLTNREVDIRIATGSDINKALSSYYRVQSSVDEAVQDVNRQTASISGSTQIMSQSTPTDVSTVNSEDAPVVRLVNSILEQAVKEKASDIHIEPSDSTTKVRMRMDGTLFSTTEIPKNLHMPLLARIKILAGIDIAEKRRPQDGRILIKVSGKKMDIRVSTLPTVFGEKAVLRLLAQDNEHVGIENLGFNHEQAEELKQLVTVPNGIILVTGPTGSGKSTTLYSLLALINTPEVNIITIEDPVEYTVAGVTQVQVNEKIDLTFGSVLRSILRQDPDKLMVGEIRDPETAHLAVRVALTGHLVLSTLHTNDAAASINRLVDMGVPNFLLASSLRGIIAQRLVRKLCDKCKKESEVTEQMSHEIQLPQGTKIFSPVGCPSCRFTGYSGRTVIAELMIIDPTLREMINKASPQQEIKDQAIKNGMATLRDIATIKVLDGTISAEEMLLTTMFD
jgi:type IV pilus assembly protein PilB